MEGMGTVTEHTPDTVAPMDVGEDEGEFTPFGESTGNITLEHYDTQGRTTVATRRGYRFAPSDKALPVVTHRGVKMSKDAADEVVAESNGVVHVVEDIDEED